MKIKACIPDDIDDIFKLYHWATEYQKKTFPGNVWPVFERSMVATEIEGQRQYKIVIDGNMACVWAITFSDPQIWEERDQDAAIYIHRIATNPIFRGQHFVSEIVNWAKRYAHSQHKRFIRMDTCGDNQKLIKHYVKSGFDFLGMHQLTCADGLPSHYHKAQVCFFEIDTQRL